MQWQQGANHILPAGGPLPKFDGIPPPANIPGPPPGSPPLLQAQNSGGPIRVPPLTPDKVSQYSSLFEGSGAQNGNLSGWSSFELNSNRLVADDPSRRNSQTDIRTGSIAK